MAITYVNASSAAGTSLTLPTHQAGDLILASAFTTGGSTPTLPTGWSPIRTNSTSGRRSLVAWRIAQDASTAFGTWTNATVVATSVYRSDASKLILPSTVNWLQAGAATVITYSAHASGNRYDLDTWVVGFCGLSIDGAGETPPTGMTNRTHTFSTNEIAIHDTNGLSTWGSTVTVATTSANLFGLTLAIYESEIPIPSSGGGVPLIGPGGLVY